jgi:hypothetical protein
MAHKLKTRWVEVYDETEPSSPTDSSVCRVRRPSIRGWSSDQRRPGADASAEPHAEPHAAADAAPHPHADAAADPVADADAQPHALADATARPHPGPLTMPGAVASGAR